MSLRRCVHNVSGFRVQHNVNWSPFVGQLLLGCGAGRVDPNPCFLAAGAPVRDSIISAPKQRKTVARQPGLVSTLSMDSIPTDALLHVLSFLSAR